LRTPGRAVDWENAPWPDADQGRSALFKVLFSHWKPVQNSTYFGSSFESPVRNNELPIIFTFDEASISPSFLRTKRERPSNGRCKQRAQRRGRISERRSERVFPPFSSLSDLEAVRKRCSFYRLAFKKVSEISASHNLRNRFEAILVFFQIVVLSDANKK
jgi:hypothetical protein